MKRSAKLNSFRLGKKPTESMTTSDQTAGDHPDTALSQGLELQLETKMQDSIKSADSELDVNSNAEAMVQHMEAEQLFTEAGRTATTTDVQEDTEWADPRSSTPVPTEESQTVMLVSPNWNRSYK